MVCNDRRAEPWPLVTAELRRQSVARRWPQRQAPNHPWRRYRAPRPALTPTATVT